MNGFPGSQGNDSHNLYYASARAVQALAMSDGTDGKKHGPRAVWVAAVAVAVSMAVPRWQSEGQEHSTEIYSQDILDMFHFVLKIDRVQRFRMIT